MTFRLSMPILLTLTWTLGCGGGSAPEATPPSPLPKAGQPTAGSPAAKPPAKAGAPAGTATAKKPAAEKAPQTDGPPVLTTAQIFTLPAAGDRGEKLTIEEIRAFLADPKNHEPFLPAVPLGLEDIARYIPPDNPMTRAKVELGRQLYFDPRLSRDGTVSCATCHDPGKGWAQNSAVATGIGNQQGGRNSPTVINRAYGRTQFWDGRKASLEEQALGPIQNPIEMGFNGIEPCVECLRGIEGYRIQFEKIFGGVSADAIGKAIASFERTVLVGASPFDYFDRARQDESIPPEDLKDDPELAADVERVRKEAEAHPISAAALRGRLLFFGKASCSLCHVGANLADENFYNIGVGMMAEKPDVGRQEVTKKDEDTGAFKTPTLRNVTLNAPYMHDGSQKTLQEVIDFYDRGGHPNPHLHPRIVKLGKLRLTAEEKADLLAFVESLTGELPNIPAPRLP